MLTQKHRVSIKGRGRRGETRLVAIFYGLLNVFSSKIYNEALLLWYLIAFSTTNLISNNRINLKKTLAFSIRKTFIMFCLYFNRSMFTELHYIYYVVNLNQFSGVVFFTDRNYSEQQRISAVSNKCSPLSSNCPICNYNDVRVLVSNLLPRL